MAWLNHTEESGSQAEKAMTAFTVIRDVPSRPTARVQKVAASRGNPATGRPLEVSGIAQRISHLLTLHACKVRSEQSPCTRRQKICQICRVQLSVLPFSLPFHLSRLECIHNSPSDFHVVSIRSARPSKSTTASLTSVQSCNMYTLKYLKCVYAKPACQAAILPLERLCGTR